jgi:transcriptional regulator with XRE-family HTH domain
MSEQRETKGRADAIDKLVSRRLKMKRMMSGLSQQDVGKAVDVSIQQVQKYEKATNRISSGKLFALAKFFKVPISYFYNQGTQEDSTVESAFAETASSYDIGMGDVVTEKEILLFVKAFSEIKSSQNRKKIMEVIKIIP